MTSLHSRVFASRNLAAHDRRFGLTSRITRVCTMSLLRCIHIFLQIHNLYDDDDDDDDASHHVLLAFTLSWCACPGSSHWERPRQRSREQSPGSSAVNELFDLDRRPRPSPRSCSAVVGGCLRDKLRTQRDRRSKTDFRDMPCPFPI